MVVESKKIIMGMSNSIKRKLGKKNKSVTIQLPKEWADFYGLQPNNVVKIKLNHRIKAFMVYFDPDDIADQDI